MHRQRVQAHDDNLESGESSKRSAHYKSVTHVTVWQHYYMPSLRLPRVSQDLRNMTSAVRPRSVLVVSTATLDEAAVASFQREQERNFGGSVICGSCNRFSRHDIAGAAVCQEWLGIWDTLRADFVDDRPNGPDSEKLGRFSGFLRTSASLMS